MSAAPPARRGYFGQLASESVVYGLSSVLSKMAYILLVPIYTRVFSPAEYGAMSLVVTVMAAASVMVVLALDNSAHRWFYESDDAADRKATIASWAWCQVGVALLFAVAISAGAERIGEALVGTRAAGGYVRLAAWALPLSAMSMVCTNWLRMQRRAWGTLLFNLATVASSLLLTVALVVGMGQGIAGVFQAQLLTAAWTTVVAVAVMRDWLHPAHFRRGRLAEMLRYALPLIPAALSFWVVNAIDRLFVQRYSTTADVGVYQVGYAVASCVALGTQAFQQAWGPFSMSIHREADARKFYADALLVYLWLTCLASTVVGVLAPEILRVFAGPAYAGASRVVALLAFGYVMIGLTYIAGLGPSLARRTSPVGIAITAAAGLNIALNLVLTPRLGKEGAALSTLLSQAAVPLYLFRRSQQLYPIPYRFGAAIAIVALAGAATAVGISWRFSTPWIGVPVKLLLAGSLVPALFALRIVSLATVSGAVRRLRMPAGSPSNGVP